MIGVRVPQIFGPRFPEWAGAFQCMLAGIALVHPYETFSSDAYTFFRWMPEYFWGIIFFVVGMARFISLVINGHRKKVTSNVRLAASIIACGIWSGVCFGLALSGVVGLWIAAFPIAVLVEYVNIYRATHDMRVANHG